MDFITHLIIAGKISNIVKKQLNMKLNTYSFMLGNIKPDFSSKYIHIEHYKKDSNSFLHEEIHEIMNLSIYNKNCTSSFSERLGIITHYLSDFFCYAHSEHFKGTMTQHYLYEIKMLFNNIRNYRRISLAFRDIPIELKHSKTSISEYIEVLNNKYLCVCKGKSSITDMTYTLYACKFLCLSIISSCMTDKEELSNVAYS